MHPYESLYYRSSSIKCVIFRLRDQEIRVPVFSTITTSTASADSKSSGSGSAVSPGAALMRRTCACIWFSSHASFSTCRLLYCNPVSSAINESQQTLADAGKSDHQVLKTSRKLNQMNCSDCVLWFTCSHVFFMLLLRQATRILCLVEDVTEKNNALMVQHNQPRKTESRAIPCQCPCRIR